MSSYEIARKICEELGDEEFVEVFVYLHQMLVQGNMKENLMQENILNLCNNSMEMFEKLGNIFSEIVPKDSECSIGAWWKQKDVNDEEPQPDAGKKSAEKYVPDGTTTPIRGMHLVNQRICGSKMNNRTYIGCSFRNVAFDCVEMEETVFKDCSFYDCSFKMCNLKNATFENCTMLVRFVMCNFSFTKVIECQMKNGYFAHCQFDLTLFDKTIFNGYTASQNTHIGPVIFVRCCYTMGGATAKECEKAKYRFIMEFDEVSQEMWNIGQ